MDSLPWLKEAMVPRQNSGVYSDVGTLKTESTTAGQVPGIRTRETTRCGDLLSAVRESYSSCKETDSNIAENRCLARIYIRGLSNYISTVVVEPTGACMVHSARI